MAIARRGVEIPDSPLARWDPRWKLAALLLASATFAVVGHPALTATAFAIGLFGIALARLNLRATTGRLLLTSIAMLPVIAVFPFTNDNGLTLALSLTLRALALACVAMMLLGTAPLAQTFAAAHRIYLPGALVQIALLAHRYSLLFFSEAHRLRIALRTRAFRAGTNLQTYRTMGHATGSLLVRGGDRAEQVADAMRTRGFAGEFHCVQRFRTTAWDVAGFAFAILLLAGLLIGEWCL